MFAAEIWFDDIDYDFHTNCSAFDVYTVALHEFGHYIGWLDDSTNDTTSVMFATYNGCHNFLDLHAKSSVNAIYNASH